MLTNRYDYVAVTISSQRALISCHGRSRNSVAGKRQRQAHEPCKHSAVSLAYTRQALSCISCIHTAGIELYLLHTYGRRSVEDKHMVRFGPEVTRNTVLVMVGPLKAAELRANTTDVQWLTPVAAAVNDRYALPCDCVCVCVCVCGWVYVCMCVCMCTECLLSYWRYYFAVLVHEKHCRDGASVCACVCIHLSVSVTLLSE
jgi:hypothetical protein